MADKTETGEGQEATEAAHGAADAAHGAAESAGMPQLEFSTFPNQIFWLVIALVAIYFILSRVALPRIATILAERQGTITNDIAAAEELKLKAQEAEEAYQKALADARAESLRISAEARAEIQAELDDAIIKADAEIAAKTAESSARIDEIRVGAVESVGVVSRETAAEIVAALGGQADDASVSGAVEEQMKG